MQSNADSSFGDRLQPFYDMQGVSSGQKVSKSTADLQSRIDNISVPPAVQLPHDYDSGLQQRIQGISIPPELEADTASHSGGKSAAGGKPDVYSGSKSLCMLRVKQGMHWTVSEGQAVERRSRVSLLLLLPAHLMLRWALLIIPID